MEIKVKIPTIQEFSSMAKALHLSTAEVAQAYATPEALAKTLGVDSVIAGQKDPSGTWLQAGSTVTAVINHGIWGKFEIPFNRNCVLTTEQAKSLEQIHVESCDGMTGAYFMVADTPAAQQTINLLQENLSASHSGISVFIYSDSHFAFNDSGYLKNIFNELAINVAPYLTEAEQVLLTHLEFERPVEGDPDQLELTANTPKEIQLLKKLRGLLEPDKKGWDGSSSIDGQVDTATLAVKMPPRPVSSQRKTLAVLESRLGPSLTYEDDVALEEMDIEETHQKEGFYSLSLTSINVALLNKVKINLVANHSVGGQYIKLSGDTLTFELATDANLPHFLKTQAATVKSIQKKSALYQLVEPATK